MSLWVPESVQAKNEQRDLLVQEARGQFAWFERRLKDIDERLDLVCALERIDAKGFMPGFWHIRRRNDGAADSYMPICGPNGEFMEPSECHLDELASRDMWRDPKVAERKFEAIEREHESKKRLAREDRRERMKDAVLPHTRLQVAVP